MELPKDEERHAWAAKTQRWLLSASICKNSFHVVGLDQRGAIVLRQRWSRGQVEARFANIPQCLIGMEACVGADHLSRKLKDLGHDARLMPAKCARPYSKGQKNNFRYTEAIAEAVQRPTMKLVAATRPAGAAPGALARRLAVIMNRIWVDGTESSGPERPLWHARRTRPHALGEHWSSTEQWKDVPRGTMDELSSFGRLDLPFV